MLCFEMPLTVSLRRALEVRTLVYVCLTPETKLNDKAPGVKIGCRVLQIRFGHAIQLDPPCHLTMLARVLKAAGKQKVQWHF